MKRKLMTVPLLAALAACGGGGTGAGPSPAEPGCGGTCLGAVTPSVAKPTGFFAMTGLTTSTADKTALLALPYVSGMTSFVAWKDIEPARGRYDFSRLDADIALAASAGKKVSIGVFAGKDTIPDWVAGQGIRTWVTGQGKTLIHPSDPAFVTLWADRVAELGARYGTHPTVVQVAMCGAAGTLCGPRYPELPADAQYADVLANWSQVIAAYVAAFPATYKHLEVQLSSNGWGVNLPVDLAMAASSSAKIGPFAEFLSDTAPAAESVAGVGYARIAQTRDWCGFQMVSPLGAAVADAVRHGRSYGCEYFEIYASDLRDFGPLLSALVKN